MSINSESEIAANIQIGPTSEGRVRIYISGDGLDLPLDFDPEEADEIAAELMGAAVRARGASGANGRGGTEGTRDANSGAEALPNQGVSKRARRRRKKREAEG